MQSCESSLEPLSSRVTRDLAHYGHFARLPPGLLCLSLTDVFVMTQEGKELSHD